MFQRQGVTERYEIVSSFCRENSGESRRFDRISLRRTMSLYRLHGFGCHTNETARDRGSSRSRLVAYINHSYLARLVHVSHLRGLDSVSALISAHQRLPSPFHKSDMFLNAGLRSDRRRGSSVRCSPESSSSRQLDSRRETQPVYISLHRILPPRQGSDTRAPLP